MSIETINFHGWSNTLRLANESAELIVTTDVGPRILVYRAGESANVLKTYEEQFGGSNEEEWRIRGGHRFWLAPEEEILTYHLDNGPAAASATEEAVTIESVQERPQAIRKSLSVALDAEGSSVSLRHTATNEGESPITLGTWALTVMRPGGLEIIPQPPLGEHPRDLLPNRGIILWPYTDLSDPRWTFGCRYWMLRQQEDLPPTKIGIAHREQWIGYVLEDSLFLKVFEFAPSAEYPDGGCNFETFTNTEMLEIESLGPLVTLNPGESTSHEERWHLFPLTEEIQIESEDHLAEWITPFLEKAGLR